MSKAHCLYDSSMYKIIKSREVNFDEVPTHGLLLTLMKFLLMGHSHCFLIMISCMFQCISLFHIKMVKDKKIKSML